MVLTSNELCQILFASTLVAQIEPPMSSSGGVPGEVAKSESQTEPRYAPTKELYTDAAFGSFGLLEKLSRTSPDIGKCIQIFQEPWLRFSSHPATILNHDRNVIFLSVKMPL